MSKLYSPVGGVGFTPAPTGTGLYSPLTTYPTGGMGGVSGGWSGSPQTENLMSPISPQLQTDKNMPKKETAPQQTTPTPDLKTTEQKMATGELRGLGTPIEQQTSTEASLRSSAVAAQAQHLAAATNLPYALFVTPAGQPTKEFEQYSAQLGKYSYTNLLEKGIAEAKATGKGYVAGLGVTLEAKREYQTIETTAIQEQQQRLFTYRETATPDLSPRAYAPPVMSFAVESQFGIRQTMPGVSGVPAKVTEQKTGLVIGETVSNAFGLAITPPIYGKASEQVKTKIVMTPSGIYPVKEELKISKPTTQEIEYKSQSIYEDIDIRFQQMVSERRGFFIPSKQNTSEALREVGTPLGGSFQQRFVYGAKLAVIDFPAVELTKMGLGFTQATLSYGYALRYGEPSVSPYIKIIQSITGTKPTLTKAETEAKFKEGGAGVVATFSLPVTLAAMGYAQKVVSSIGVGGASLIGKSKTIQAIGSSLPFSVSGVAVAKTITQPSVFYSFVSGASVYSLTESGVPEALGAGVSTFAAIKGFEAIGSKIIEGRKAATPEQAYSERGVRGTVERIFVQTKEYSTAEEAAKFYVKATPEEFVAALKEGARYGAYRSEQIPRMVSAPAPGQEALYPRVGEFVLNPKKGEAGFSKLEFQLALAKLQGKTIPPRYTSVPIEGFEFPKGGELVRNPAYAEFMRGVDFAAAFKATQKAKPTFTQYIAGKAGGISDFIGETSVKVIGGTVQRGIDTISPRIDVAASALKGTARISYAGAATSSALMTAPVVVSPKTIPSPALIQAISTPSKPYTIAQMERDIVINAKVSERFRIRNEEVIGTKTSLITTQRQEVRQEIATQLKSGLETTLRASTRQTLKQELKYDMRTELRMDVRQELKTEYRQELKQKIIQPPRTKINLPFKTADLGGFIEKPGKRAKGKYQPSFTAVVFNIRGKISKGAAETGLAIRPIRGGRK